MLNLIISLSILSNNIFSSSGCWTFNFDRYDFVYCCSNSQTLKWQEYCKNVNSKFYCMDENTTSGANTCPLDFFFDKTTATTTTTHIDSPTTMKIQPLTLENQIKTRLSDDSISKCVAFYILIKSNSFLPFFFKF